MPFDGKIDWVKVRATLSVLRDGAWLWIKNHPTEVFIVSLMIARLAGTTIQTGWRGVLFRWGKLRGVLEPGFHPLVPWMHTVRKTQVRARTLDLAKQRVTTRDGLVYDVDVNLIFRIDDPQRALVEIDDYRAGCETILALALQELIHASTNADLADRDALDVSLRARIEPRLTRWGITVDTAGLTSIAPTDETLRITQLLARVRERQETLNGFEAQGLSRSRALALLGAQVHFRSRSHARSRLEQRRVTQRRAQIRKLLAERRLAAQRSGEVVDWEELEEAGQEAQRPGQRTSNLEAGLAAKAERERRRLQALNQRPKRPRRPRRPGDREWEQVRPPQRRDPWDD